jgi:phenylalanyl-tRNA synthetase beta chain
MKVPLSWLRELCPTDLSAESLADLLSIRGVHVEAVLKPWERLSGVVVARVLDVADHPASDRLCIARVSYGSGERELVVGVRNMKPGDLVPLAGPGARVPALPAPLEARPIRGVVSEGMLCSARELGISADHTAILVLPPDTPVGADVKDRLGLDDAVLDIEIEPNRPDLMSVLGVAREASAATGAPLTEPDLTVAEDPESAEAVATVQILDLDGCPRYIARVIRSVAVGASPLRVQARLTAAGMRPISNVVDATNYAMLAVGQPLHAFDLHLLAGQGVVVRRAEEGEALLTLDGEERTLHPEDLVIADRERAVAIAGIMGSALAEVSPSTTDVLLESAYFEPKTVIRTSRRLGMQTEASLRFGRGADPENPPRGAALAARLVSKWAGGAVLSGAAEVGEPRERLRLGVRPSRAALIAGYPVSAADVASAFDRLRVATRSVREDLVEVEVPGYRVDLGLEIDLIEEVIRVQGYERVGSTVPDTKQVGSVPDSHTLRRRVREAMVRSGLREALSLSFASAADLELMGHREGIRLRNPVVEEEPYLRTSLIPNLLRALGRNAARGSRGAALFEVGHVFRPDGPVDEREALAAAMWGAAGGHDVGASREFDFFDAKGVVEALMEGLAISGWSLGEPAGAPLHPARSAVVLVAGEPAGILGEIHPGVADGLDLGRTAVFELDMSRLASNVETSPGLRNVSRFPPVHRDLAFVVDADAPAGAVRSRIEEAAGEILDSVTLFDVFVGAPIPSGRKSLAYSLAFRAADRTLTDEEAQGAVDRIVERLRADFGAELRSG